ncbi:MAG: hypothetical protein M3036_17615, partial [Bifidobacteriales bacterium]|nr:hypothetical protein [Bifidobacteriales bacterium]
HQSAPRRSQVLAPYRHYRVERRTGSQYGLFTFAYEQFNKNDAQFSASLLPIEQLQTNRAYAYLEAALA